MKKKTIIIITSAAILAVIIAVSLFFILGKHEDNKDENTLPSLSVAEKSTDIVHENTETTETPGGYKVKEHPEEIQDEYQVGFWIGDESFDVQVALYDGSVMPKSVGFFPGKIFTGWDADLNNIRKNITAKAQFIDVTDKANCIGIESGYCRKDESVTLDVMLCGKVDLSTLDFRIIYDKSVLSLDSVENADPSVLFNHDNENGILYCSLLLDGTVDGDIDCMELVFSLLDDSQNGKVTIEIDDASRFDGNDIVDAEATAVNATVFAVR